MPVEIQSIVLCQSIQQTETGTYDAKSMAVCMIYPIDGRYPFVGDIGLHLVLRKETKLFNIDFDIRICMLDADGNIMNDSTISGNFPEGYRFWAISAPYKFNIPKPGNYSLFIECKSDGNTQHARYDIESGLPETPGPKKTIPFPQP